MLNEQIRRFTLTRPRFCPSWMGRVFCLVLSLHLKKHNIKRNYRLFLYLCTRNAIIWHFESLLTVGREVGGLYLYVYCDLNVT